MINALRQGDALVFELVYKEYSKKVYAFFRKRTDSEEDARDLLQTTFLKLWKYRKSLSDDYLLEQHLFHIARTVFIDFLRKQNKNAHLQKDMLLKTGQREYHNPVALYAIYSQLTAALAAMPEIRCKVFILNRIEGYSYKEVSELLSISLKSVDNNLTKALRQLRKQIIISIVLFVFLSL